MIQSEKSQSFYGSLAHLFYSVASVDKAVRTDEIQTLKNIVKEKWLDADDYEDAFGTDTAFQIEIVFDWLLDAEPSSESCFKVFEEYKKDNEKQFSQKMKSLIWETADSIAASFSGKNKSEIIVLAKLKQLL